jgi:hypothetical protein
LICCKRPFSDLSLAQTVGKLAIGMAADRWVKIHVPPPASKRLAKRGPQARLDQARANFRVVGTSWCRCWTLLAAVAALRHMMQRFSRVHSEIFQPVRILV